MNIKKIQRKVNRIRKSELTPEEKIKILENIKKQLISQEKDAKPNNLKNNMSEFAQFIAHDKDVNIQIGGVAVVGIVASAMVMIAAKDTSLSLMTNHCAGFIIGACGALLTNIAINGGNCDKKEILDLIDKMIEENQSILEKSNI